MSSLKHLFEKHKRCLRVVDNFGIAKINSEDGKLVYKTAIGGIFTLLLIPGIIAISIYYIVEFFVNPTITVSESQYVSENIDYSTLTFSQSYTLNQTYGLYLNMDYNKFDFAVFFPGAYNSTLDSLFSGTAVNPMNAVGVSQGSSCRQPFYVALSHFSAVIYEDKDSINGTVVTTPVQYIGIYNINGIDGRLYGIYYLDKNFIGSNYRIDIKLQLVKTTADYPIDFYPLNVNYFVKHVYFLYRSYSFDTEKMVSTSMISYYDFKYYPPGSSGSDINQCTLITLQPTVLEVLKQSGLFGSTTSVLKKFNAWPFTINEYLYGDTYGVCPDNDFINVYNGENPNQPVDCVSPQIKYEPFTISIQGSKIKATYTITYSNISYLLSAIGGTVSIVISIISSLAKTVNTKFYETEVKNDINSNLNDVDLKQIDFDDLDPEQKQGLYHVIDKAKEKNREIKYNKLNDRKKRKLQILKPKKLYSNEIDQKIYNEGTKTTDSNDKENSLNPYSIFASPIQVESIHEKEEGKLREKISGIKLSETTEHPNAKIHPSKEAGKSPVSDGISRDESPSEIAEVNSHLLSSSKA